MRRLPLGGTDAGWTRRLNADLPFMIAIRPMRSDEFATLRDIRLRALQDTPLAFGSTYESESALTDEQWKIWAQKRTAPGESATFLAFDADTCCGIVGCMGRNEEPSAACIISMWVAPEVRRQGVGSRLIVAAERWAREQGFATLSLDVTEQNLPAIALYERCGFRFTGKWEPYKNDPMLREMSMVKELRPEAIIPKP